MSTITLLAITAPTPYNKNGSLLKGRVVENEKWVGLLEEGKIILKEPSVMPKRQVKRLNRLR